MKRPIPDCLHTPTAAQVSAASMLLELLPSITGSVLIEGGGINGADYHMPVIRADWLERELRKIAR